MSYLKNPLTISVRKSFAFFDKDVAHYFPGHMHKG